MVSGSSLERKVTRELGRVTRDLEHLRKVVKGLLEREGPRVTSAVPKGLAENKGENKRMSDKIKAGIAAFLTLLVVAWPGASEYIEAAGGQPEIIAAVIAVYTVVHGLIEFTHTKVSKGG